MYLMICRILQKYNYSIHCPKPYLQFFNLPYQNLKNFLKGLIIKNNIILGLSSIIAITACSSSTTLTPATINYSELTAGTDLKKILPANKVVILTSAENILTINVDEAPVGATMSVTDFDGIKNALIKVTDKISGESTIEITGTVEGQSLTYEIQLEDIDSILEAQINLSQLSADTDPAGIVNTLFNATIKNSDDIEKTFTIINQTINPLNDDEKTFAISNAKATMDTVMFSVMADDKKSTVTGLNIQNDNKLSIVDGFYSETLNISTGAQIVTDKGESFLDAAGDFEYIGHTIIIAGDDTYLDKTSTLKMNFTNKTGELNSNDFSLHPDANELGTVAGLEFIEIKSALKLNNTTGAITSTTGTVNSKVNIPDIGVTSNININAFMTPDHSAVAGSINVISEVNKTQPVENGVFGFVVSQDGKA